MIDFFFHPVEKILQTKDSTTKALHRLNIFNIRDLLFHKPSHYIIKNINPNLSNLFNNENIIFEAKIEEIIISSRKTGPHKIFVSNETGGVELVFFHNIPQFIYSNLKIGNILTIEGKVKKIGGYPQISHPDLIFNKESISKFEPVYPLTYGLVNKQIHSLILKSLSLIPELTLTVNDDINISLTKSLSNIHKPKKIDNNQKTNYD